MKTALEILADARALIADPEKWYQGAWCKPGETSCMCMEAALRIAADGKWIHPVGATFPVPMAFAGPFDDAIEVLSTVIGDSIAEWQDEPGRTHEEVMVAFDEAIATLRAEPS